MSESYPHSNSDATSSSGDEAEWMDANQDDEQEEALSIISLVDDRVFTDAGAMLAYCKEKTGLDFLEVRDRLGLDFHGMVKLINFVRQRVHEGKAVPGDITAADLEDDSLLKPVLEDDALILCLDDLPEAGAAAAETDKDKVSSAAVADAPQVDALLQKNAQLQAELEQLAKQFTNYRLAVQKTLDQRWQADEEPEDAPSSSSKGGKGGKVEAEGSAKKKDDSSYYFESYAHNDIHEVMLKDAVRTDAYRDFIYANKDLFAGKTVLDIGCGTGILSMFCARAGAARVIAVDRSDILDKARENIFHNGLDSIITCVKGCIEDVTLPVAQVDIIVSEWMGYALLYEAMLPSVLYARDRYLAPGGLLVPSHCNMWIAPVSDAEYVADHIAYWRDVYGFDFQAMQRGIYADSRVQVSPPETIVGAPSMYGFLDLHTVKTSELVFRNKWESVLSPEKITAGDALDGFLVWFDMFFARSRDDPSIAPTSTAQDWAASGKTKEDRVAFTTGPFGTATHWKQILFLVDPKTKQVKKFAEAEKGKKVAGEIEYVTADGHARGLEIKISWAVEGEETQEQMWLLH
ncbi:S-adenosyl-L-methionine-dependent methyltransferase [Cercophora newfieldiana]|uniref:type I protein arginine methyltransferase n=1 Tax=Cercophora newfieldiana TaxID=92897 RepID=A0AA40CW32_9PEZI|nr:S-adenosyl-L-methionine-dependent methyltransferase [Cercophora newfieldiana]